MSFVRVFLHNDSIYPDVWQEPLKDAMQGIIDRRKAALQYLHESRADHVVYATEVYDGYHTVKEIHLYMEAMSEDTFQERTKLWGEHNDGIIYAVHK